MWDDCYGSRVARDALVLGSGGSLNQDPTAPSLDNTSETATCQQVPQQCCIPESSCVTSGFQESNSGRLSSEVAERIKAPQRDPQVKCINQGGWVTTCLQLKISKPATITGYSTAIC